MFDFLLFLRCEKYFLLIIIFFIMTFKGSIKSCFNKYASFEGRASRSEFWYFALFNCLVSTLFMIVNVFFLCNNMEGIVGFVYILQILFSLVVVLPSFAVVVRRLHDIGKSGWWFLITLIPLFGVIIYLIFLLTESEPWENEYGPKTE